MLKRTSSQLSRAQLIGMIARLRAHLRCTLQVVEDETDRDRDQLANLNDARNILDRTTFDTDDQDLVNGGFDQSWEET